MSSPDQELFGKLLRLHNRRECIKRVESPGLSASVLTVPVVFERLCMCVYCTLCHSILPVTLNSDTSSFTVPEINQPYHYVI